MGHEAREVAVTGLGAVTPLGSSATATWEGVCANESGADRIQRFDPDAEGLRTTVACEVDDEAVQLPEAVDERTTGRPATYGLAAAWDALADAGYDPTAADWTPERVGTSVACALGGVPEIEETVQEGGRPSPRFLLNYLPNMVTGHISEAVGAQGPARTQAAACAAGTHALADAADDIRQGRADVVIAGGAEAAVSPVGVGSFESMRALSSADEPTAASRPFDADRDGFVLGEGAGILVLEAMDRARERDAGIYATLAGAGLSADAHHPTRPIEDGSGLRRAIEAALGDADVEASAVDHVNAHATSTPAGDAAEATALAEAFDGAPPTTGSKSQLGHALGAAGAIEVVVAVSSLAAGTLPPTRNYETPDPDCDIPVVTEARSTAVETVVSTSAGFGGTNGALVFEQP